MIDDLDDFREPRPEHCGCDTCSEDRGEPSPLYTDPSPSGPAEHGGGRQAPGGESLPGFLPPRTCLICGETPTLAPDEVCSGCVGRVTPHGAR